MDGLLPAANDGGQDNIARSLGRIPSGLFIITAICEAGLRTGMLASWVQQASFEPPLVTVAVNRKRYLVDWLKTAPVLGVNILGEQHKSLLKHFSAGFEPGEEAFAGLEIHVGETGVPLLTNCVASLEGTVVSQMECGDHVIVAVRVTAAHFNPTAVAEKPWVHLRKNGLKY